MSHIGSNIHRDLEEQAAIYTHAARFPDINADDPVANFPEVKAYLYENYGSEAVEVVGTHLRPERIKQVRVNPETGELEERIISREEWLEQSTAIAVRNAERIRKYIVDKYGEWRIPSIEDWGDFKRKQKEEARRDAEAKEQAEETSD